jgi:leader peptidase (prepilin peptidase) / N-methyltransferase
MPYWQVLTILILGIFAIGAVVGSFLNVCIYRIPWEKSVIWPASHCPRCWSSIEPRDNIPIVSWLALRGECRHCGLPIAHRYPLIEALVGLLFAAVYFVDVIHGREIPWGALPVSIPVGLGYYLALVALLVAATFIDYDLWIIPDGITVPGMFIGVLVGCLFPEIRPAPSTATNHWDGLWVGVIGLLAGGGITQFVRLVASMATGREAMGFGDVTLMAMIGAFLGWQAAVLTFFLAPFFGLTHALGKLIKYMGKRIAGQKTSSADRELPYGPYLSMAALSLMLSWPWLWPGAARSYFQMLRALILGFIAVL